MCLRRGVIKATPSRKCYMWYAKMCVLDTEQLPAFKHRDYTFSDHLFEMASISMESEESVLLKESVIRSHHVFKEI